MSPSETAPKATVPQSGSVDLFKALAQHRLDLVDELSRELHELTESSSQKQEMIAELDASNTERLRLLRAAEATHKGVREQLRMKDAEIRKLTSAVAEMRDVAENRLGLLKKSELASEELQEELARRKEIIDAGLVWQAELTKRQEVIDELTAALQAMHETAEERLALLHERNVVLDRLRREIAGVESLEEAAAQTETKAQARPDSEVDATKPSE